MNQQQLIDLALILLFGTLFLFGLKTGTVPGLGGPAGLSFDRDTQPKRFWLLMTINATMVVVGAVAALRLVAYTPLSTRPRHSRACRAIGSLETGPAAIIRGSGRAAAAQ